MKALRLAALVVFPLLLAAQQTDLVNELKFRQIGPFRGGRSVAVTGVPSQPDTYYFGAVGGGVFKTTDSGLSWLPVSDGQFKTGSVGALAVADSDPNIVYAGMGEACVRGNATHGDGVYKSVDAGRTWRNIGLEDSYHIGAVRVHPKNPDIVYVAALGHLWGPNEMRGVYRTTDGGATWKQVLKRGGIAGSNGAGVGAGGSRRWRPVPLRQWGAQLDQGERPERSETARVVLRAHLRRYEECRHGVRAECGYLPFHRRRPHVRRSASAAWRQSRPVDRAQRPEPDDREQRRRRHHHARRRAHQR